MNHERVGEGFFLVLTKEEEIDLAPDGRAAAAAAEREEGRLRGRRGRRRSPKP